MVVGREIGALCDFHGEPVMSRCVVEVGQRSMSIVGWDWVRCEVEFGRCLGGSLPQSLGLEACNVGVKHSEDHLVLSFMHFHGQFDSLFFSSLHLLFNATFGIFFSV